MYIRLLKVKIVTDMVVNKVKVSQKFITHAVLTKIEIFHKKYFNMLISNELTPLLM